VTVAESVTGGARGGVTVYSKICVDVVSDVVMQNIEGVDTSFGEQNRRWAMLQYDP
jgi:hypothetical protein